MKLKSRILALVVAVVMLAALPMPAIAADGDIKPKHVSIYRDDRGISNTTVTLKKGDTIDLEARIYPDDANTDTDVTWDSSNFAVAIVDRDGEVTAEGPGEATITVRTDNGFRSSITIYVPGTITDGVNSYTYQPLSSSSSSTTSSSSGTSLSKTSVKLTKTLDRDTLVSDVKKAGGKKVTYSNYNSVSASSLKAAAAAGKSKLNFDTKSGKSYAGRLVVTPSAATKLTGSLKVGVYAGVANTSSVQSYFDSNFYNNCRVVLCDQKDFTMNVEIVVPVGKLSSSGLKFYTYNTSTKKYTEFKPSNVSKDSKNFLHFTTSKGGYIVISEGALREI